jgi:hypothetical protein
LEQRAEVARLGVGDDLTRVVFDGQTPDDQLVETELLCAGDLDGAVDRLADGCAVDVFTPEARDAAMASWPCSLSCATSVALMSPVPPITTIFVMNEPSDWRAARCLGVDGFG